MNVVHQLTGYDKADDERVFQAMVGPLLLGLAKDLAAPRDDDPDAVFPYPLTPVAARILADALGARIDTQRNDYFLEAFAAADAPRTGRVAQAA